MIRALAFRLLEWLTRPVDVMFDVDPLPGGEDET
jgi:hypothetical protein